MRELCKNTAKIKIEHEDLDALVKVITFLYDVLILPTMIILGVFPYIVWVSFKVREVYTMISIINKWIKSKKCLSLWITKLKVLDC